MCIIFMTITDYLCSYTSHMSKDSEETNLIPKDIESTVAENNVEKTGQKLKRNYCYVCRVQCTAAKNYREHQKGKKHIKNINLQKDKKTVTQSTGLNKVQEKKKKGKKKPTKTTNKQRNKNFNTVVTPTKRNKNFNIVVTPTKSLVLESKNSLEQEQNTTNSDFVKKLDNTTMNNFNSSAQNSQYNNNRSYGSKNYDTHYPKYNYGHYPNSYRSDNRYYDGRPYYGYSRWNFPFSNANSAHNNDFRSRSQYYTQPVPPPEGEYFPGNQYAFSNSYGNNCESFINDSDISSYDAKSLEAAKQIPFYSNLSSSKNMNTPSKNINAPSINVNKPSEPHNPENSISSSDPLNEKSGNQKVTGDMNQPCLEDGASTSKPITPISQIIGSQYKINSRMRSRSLSSSEIEKQVKDKNEAKIDSDATEEERIKEWTNSLLETNHNQISRLINPSNYKEKAALNHLITKFSKSKRKIQILSRSSSIDLSDNNEEDVTTEEASKLDEFGNSAYKEKGLVVDTRDKNSILGLPDTSTPKVCKNKKKSKNSNSDKDLISATMKLPRKHSSKKSSKSSGKIKSSILSNSNLSSESGKEKEKIAKRKSSDDSIVMGKKQKTGSMEIFETTTNIRNVELLEDLYKEATSVENFYFPDSTQTSCQGSSGHLSELKEEVMEHFEVNETVSSTTTSSEKLQDQNLPFSSEISVETLIQLFATGSVKVKEEFNDPVMEAIKDISSDELVNACSSQFLNESESANKVTSEKNTASRDRISKDNTGSVISAKTNEVNKECVNPVVMSPSIHENMTPTSISEKRGSILSSTPISNKAESQKSLSSNNEKSGSVLSNASTSDKVESQKSLSSNNEKSDSVLSNASTSGKAENQKCLPSGNNKNSIDSLSEVGKLNELNQAKLPSSVNKLIIQLQVISTQEEAVKQNLTDAKSKINEINSLLEEWIKKKRKLQEEEEVLRKQRNEIIKALQNAVKSGSDESNEEPTSSVPEERTIIDQPVIAEKQNEPVCTEINEPVCREINEPVCTEINEPVCTEINEPVCTEITVFPAKSHTSSSSSSSSSSYEKKRKSRELPETLESDEIIILPLPTKPKPPEIIICDDEETSPVPGGSRSSLGNSKKLQTSSDSKFSKFSRIDNRLIISDDEEFSPLPSKYRSTLRDSRSEIKSCVASAKRQTLYDFKTIRAHPTVINSLVVFEDFLYTCSNDSTAKRFSLKDSSLTVTYFHAAKNVTEVVVEKVQNEALVFTSCSTRVISLFIASSGTKIKSFFPPSSVMSICKGWGKFYSGLANGSVNVYNWKYEEIEIVKTEQQPASRIATAHQGRLHVLVILSSEGNISIRDAETGLLIRYIKIHIKHPSWMCLHRDLVYLSSADKSLIILDVMSGREEKRLYLSNHATGLAVYDDYIFAISYSGIINCYNKDNSSDKKLYYGAGKGALTCVHVYRDWVFTGNRKGDVSVFHFDPNSTSICEFAKCDMIYGLTEDLEYHVEKDHLSKKKHLRCNWKGCDFTFPRNADNLDKMNHIKVHIHEILL